MTERTLARMKEDGGEWVSILVSWCQDDIRATEIRPLDRVTPADEALIHVIGIAHSLGMKVALKPHVDPRTGEWRGRIRPRGEADWRKGFESYDRFLGHYLDLARENQVEAVIIGTELAETEPREADWRRAISLARSRFPGLLTYDANHGAFFRVKWRDALDFIGVSAYFPLTPRRHPTDSELRAAWSLHIKNLRAFAEKTGKDIVFTEIGYLSRDGSNITPWEYQLSTPPDREEQADCYRAALESLYNEPWFKGMYWWAWSGDPSRDDNGYDIRDKPAEDVVREWYTGGKRKP